MAENQGESIATTLRLSKALGLARQGRMREAQQMLAADGTLPENPLELHALAALATGDGDYGRAQRLWRLLLQREPGHAEAKRMIDAIELWVTRPSWCRYIPAGLTVLGLGLVFAFLAWMIGGEPPPAPKPAPRPVVSAPAYAPPSEPPPAITLPSARPAETRRNRNR
jgi:hypothetical protein